MWTPRSCLSPRRRSTASGIAPMPICSVAPSSTRSATSSPMRASTVGRRRRAARASGRLVRMKASTRVDTAPRVARGARHLLVDLGDDDARRIGRRRRRRVDRRAQRAVAVRSGGESCRSATSSGIRLRPSPCTAREVYLASRNDRAGHPSPAVLQLNRLGAGVLPVRDSDAIDTVQIRWRWLGRRRTAGRG